MQNPELVRLTSLTLKNIKNVREGVVVMPHASKKDRLFATDAEILGIYGQNGSGKTSVVDALACVHTLLRGEKLPDEKVHLITEGEQCAEIECSFAVTMPESFHYLVKYQVLLSRAEQGVRVVSEKIIYAPCVAVEDGCVIKAERYRGALIYEVQSAPIDGEFSPQSVYKKMLTQLRFKDASRSNPALLKSRAYHEHTSYVFNAESYELFIRCLDAERAGLLHALAYFAKSCFTVIERRHSGMVSLDLLPLRMSSRLGSGQIPVMLYTPNLMPVAMYAELRQLVENLNGVLSSIVPGIQIGFYELGEELSERGERVMRFELTSCRGEVVIPLRYESEGIRKILSILASLVDVYHSPSSCLVVDELDAGIFEYLLGELLKILSESGKGQLIFTSHNLRPLEMLNKESILFSTTNPFRRYIHFSGIKPNHNLRDRYICELSLHEQSEKVYEQTNVATMNRAFRKAGKVSR